jgi:hypothetical protein
VEPYSDNISFEKELNDKDALEILSLLMDVKCRRSLSSDYIYMDDPTIFLEINGNRNTEHRSMQLIMTDHSTLKVTGMNVDYIYIADIEGEDLNNSIRKIIDGND